MEDILSGDSHLRPTEPAVPAPEPVVPKIEVPDIAGPAAGDMSSVLDAIKNESLADKIRSGQYVGNEKELQEFVDALHRPKRAAQHIMDRIKRLREIDNEITRSNGASRSRFRIRLMKPLPYRRRIQASQGFFKRTQTGG
jgi:hypothetical protein